MGILTVVTRHTAWRALLVVTTLLGSVAVQAQNINVTAANSINDKVYNLTAPTTGNTTTVQNTDYKSFLSIQSLAFIVNSTTNPTSPTLDLVVADTVGGKIAVYPGDFGSGAPTVATVIWKASQGGPVVPNGLSVDAAGDLWVVNQRPLHPQLWVFPAAGTNGCTPLPAYAALCEPVLVDGKLPATELLVETASVPVVPAGGVANTGDLLVLTFNPSTVLDYAFSPGSFTPSSRTAIITLPKASTPAGMAFWPLDNSLLITNSLTNTILRFSCCSAPTQMPNFANGPGGFGKLMFKIKTGYASGAPYAFVAQTSLQGGDILAFGEGGLANTVTQNVSEPIGLAVSNTAFEPAGACNSVATNGCNPTGLLSHLVPPQVTSPPLVERICVVQHDPRVTITNGVWSCGPTPQYPTGELPINAVCGPHFDNTNKMLVPIFYCGGSGDATNPSSGFTIIQTLIDDTVFNQTLIDNDGGVDLEPTCLPTGAESPPAAPGSSPTLATLLWGAQTGGGSYIGDGKNTHMAEIGDGCGRVHSNSGGGSLWGIGFQLNLPGVVPVYGGGDPPTQLGTVIDNKYGDLAANIASFTATGNIASNVAALLTGNPGGCVVLSQNYFDFGQLEGSNPAQQAQDYTIAAVLLSNASPTTCDSIITGNPGSFVQTLGSTPPVLNPSGYVRQFLAPVYFGINTRELGNCPGTQAPPNFTTFPGTGCPTVTPPEWPPNPAPTAPSSTCPATPPSPNPYPPPGGCPTLTVTQPLQAGGSETVSWNLYGSTGCALSSADGLFNNQTVTGSPPPTNGGSQTVTASSTPGTYTYTLACTQPVASSVSTQVTVSAAPGNPSAWVGTWDGSLASTCSYAGLFNVVITSAGGNVLNVAYYVDGGGGTAVLGGSYQLTLSGNTATTTAAQQAAGIPFISYTLNGNTISVSEPTACQTGTVTLQTGSPTLSVSPASVGGGSTATVSWTLGGASSCSLSYGQASGSWQSPPPNPLPLTPATGSATYTANSNDGANLSGVPGCAYSSGVIFTLSCANNVAVQACLGVSE